MNFTWRRFLDELKPVAVFLAALFGYLGFLPELIFLGIMVWQIVTRGATIWAFFNTIFGWIKAPFNKK
jgi:hypothetical protein